MLYEEAKWVGEKAMSHFNSRDKVLNVGSSTRQLREIIQPQMSDYLFSPLKNKGIEVTHTDITENEGVDIVGDLTDKDFIAKVAEQNFDGALCCNLLEHLEDRTPLIGAFKQILSGGGILILTVPHQYPYHLDPIDTLFRPTVKELTDLFPEFEVLENEIVIGRRQEIIDQKAYFDSTYFQQLKRSKSLFFRLLFRSLLPFYKPKMWKIVVRDLINMHKPFSATCVVLQRR